MTKKNQQTKGGDALKDLITIAEAAKLRGVTRAAIYDLIGRGRLRTESLFGKTLVYRSEVESFEKDKPGPKSN